MTPLMTKCTIAMATLAYEIHSKLNSLNSPIDLATPQLSTHQALSDCKLGSIMVA